MLETHEAFRATEPIPEAKYRGRRLDREVLRSHLQQQGREHLQLVR